MSDTLEHVHHSYDEDLKELMQASSLDTPHTAPNAVIRARVSEHNFAKWVACCPEVPPVTKSIFSPDEQNQARPPPFIKAPEPPLPTQGDWRDLHQAWKEFCPCNVAGHRCAGLDLCDKLHICNQAKNKQRIIKHLASGRPRCNIPIPHHIMGTCGYVKRGEPCPEFLVNNCLYGHDHLATRLQLWEEHKGHHDYFHWKNNSQRN
ncbi:MAG: hypothetical protein ASARMPREDX12_004529 [Alectoria sarmentosa]|nr:MAG: hypothetical protein ASARMPREDX12_004529 [Alectoria sarmentosa]